MRKTSYRRVCLLGALLSSIGLSALPFTPNLPYLIVFYGVFTGKTKYSMYMFSKKKKVRWIYKHRLISLKLSYPSRKFFRNKNYELQMCTSLSNDVNFMFCSVVCVKLSIMSESIKERFGRSAIIIAISSGL